MQVTTSHGHCDLGIEQPTHDAGNDRRTCTGTAGQRFAGAAFEHAQPDMATINDLHKAGIDTLRKKLVMFDQRSLLRHRGSIDVGHYLNGMRVTHRKRAEFDRSRTDLNIISKRTLICDKRYFCGLESRRPHVDRHHAIRLQARRDDAAGSFYPDFSFLREPTLMDKAYKAARAIAALFHLAAIGIEDAVTEISLRVQRLFHQQQLIAADTKVPIGNTTDLFGIETDALTYSIKHDKVITQALHFGKL